MASSEDDEIVREFLVESLENLDQVDRDLVDLELQPGSHELLSSVFRSIHTIKGTCGFLGFSRLERLTHTGESLLSQLRDGQRSMTTDIAGSLMHMVDLVRQLLELVERTGTDDGPVEIDPLVSRLQDLLSGSGLGPDLQSSALATAVEPDEAPVDGPHLPSLVTGPVPDEPTPNSLATPPADRVPPAEAPESTDTSERKIAVEASVRVDVELLDDLVQMVGELVLTRNQVMQKLDEIGDSDLDRAAQRLNLIVSELQEAVMRTRMQPIGQVWSKIPRLVRDLSHQLDRSVNLQMEGRETELDRTLLEAVKDPLLHLVRNALDHGLESPAERSAAGKPASGQLLLRAYHESGQVVVEITDDGRGIDPARIGEAAVRRNVITADQLRRMDDRDVVGLIFEPGFSTAEAVTNVSGRGVGMDVVRTNIERIGGSVDLTSRLGHGTTFRVRIPLTLAIIPAVLVEEAGDRYAIPQSSLLELVRLEGEDLERNLEVLAGARILRLRGQLLPLVTLAGVLGAQTRSTDSMTVVVVQADDIRFGLVVDEVHDTQEIVVKPVGRQLKGLPMYAGATILGDGRVALILDVTGIAADQGIEAVSRPADPESVEREGEASTLLLLEVAPGRRAALPLGAVARLEEFRLTEVERSGQQEVVQYRESILPLVRLASAIGLTDPGLSQAATGRGVGNHRTDEPLVSVVVHDTGAQPVGIVIDRVLDVVETRVVSSAAGRRSGVLGSAVIQDRVTDLVDLDAVLALAGGLA